MGSIAVFITALLLAILGILIGFRIGQQWAPRAESKRQYWVFNGIAYAVCIVVSAFIAALGLVVLVFAVIGILGGIIAGLKYGYGDSVGPWKKVDTMMGVRNRHREREGMREGEEEPELISVQDPGHVPDRKSRRGGR